MRRSSQWLVIGGWALGVSGAVVACGDSVTGIEPPATGTDSGGGSTEDQSVAIPEKDASVPDTYKPQPLPTDGGAPTVSETGLDFGEVNCGATAAAKTFVIQNPSNATIPWSVTLGKGSSSGFAISPASGSLAPGESAQVTVTPAMIPTTASTASNAFGDVATISLGASFATVSLSQTARGAVLFWSPNPVTFGKTPTAADPVETEFAIANAGNIPATVTLTKSGSTAYALVGDSVLNATVGLTGARVSFDPPGLTPYEAAIKMAVGSTDVLCAPLPADLSVTGEGTDSVIGFSPPDVYFGDNGRSDCGGQSALQPVTIANTGANQVGFTAVLGRGTSSPFTLSKASDSIGAGGTYTLNVTPKAIPSTGVIMTEDAYGDTLKITVTGAVGGTVIRDIPLHQSARGALLTRSANSVNIGSVPIDTTGTGQYTFQNNGNVDITLNFTKGVAEFGHPATITVSKNSTATIMPTYSPKVVNPSDITDIVQLQMNPVVPTCATNPGNLELKGRGVAKSITASPSTVPFGQVLCGGRGTARTLKITNNGPATDFTTNLVKGVGSKFVVTPDHGDLPANGSIDLTITPDAIPSESSISNNFWGDTLEIFSGNGNTTAALTMTALGAIITASKSAGSVLTFPSSGTTPGGSTSTQLLTLENKGNLSADVEFHTTGSATFAATTANASLVPGVSIPNNVIISFSPPAGGPAGTTTYSGTWYTTTTATLCQTLPRLDETAKHIQLTGKGTP